jgi:hypothetical protein
MLVGMVCIPHSSAVIPKPRSPLIQETKVSFVLSSALAAVFYHKLCCLELDGCSLKSYPELSFYLCLFYCLLHHH